jgi:N-acetyl sugar amidotransferase
MPSTRPRIVFKKNICNGCLNAELKKKIDWDERKKEFLNIINKSRKKKNLYDCVVPWSGGKDSSAIAYRLKFEYGLNPLLVTFSPLIPTEIGIHNRNEMLNIGFDHILFNPNQFVAKYLSKRFFIERGNPKVAWDAGINVAPVLVAEKFDIPIIFYAEHGESEFGGKVISKEHQRTRDLSEVLEHQIGDDPRNWEDEKIKSKDLLPYIYPDSESLRKRIKAYYFSYFFKWDIFENYKMISQKINFKLAPKNRTDGTFTNYDSLDDKIDNLYYYMQYIKFGFGRSFRDASRLIQLNYLSKKDAKEKIKKYDAEFPKTYLKDVLKYFNINKKELLNIIDMHRNNELWEKKNGVWKKRFNYR